MAKEERYDDETIDSKLMIDHDYDGIKELDNPPPAWLMWIFYGTIVWSVFYVFYYHVFFDDSKIPDNLKVYGAQVAEYDNEMAEAIAALPVSTFDESSIAVLTDEANLAEGMTLYATKTCDVCHGASNIGPNLTDEFWINGGSVEDLFKVVKYGIAEKGMTAFQSQMTDEQIQQVSSYILVKLKGSETTNTKGPEGEKHE